MGGGLAAGKPDWRLLAPEHRMYVKSESKAMSLPEVLQARKTIRKLRRNTNMLNARIHVLQQAIENGHNGRN